MTMNDCERFEQIAARIQGPEAEGPAHDLTNEELDFFLAHEETCDRPDHKAVAWVDLDEDPKYKELGERAKSRFARILSEE